MKILTIPLAILFILAASIPVYSSQLAEVACRDPGDLEQLLRDGYDVIGFTEGHMAQVLLHHDSERERLDRIGFPYEITNRDFEAYLASRLPRRDPMGGYRTYDEIVEELCAIHEEYSHIVSDPVSLGESIEERDIWAIKISDNPDDEEDEPEVLFTSLIHAREVVTAEVLFGVIYWLVENYEEDERATFLIDERQIWFIPCVNPDGVAWNERYHRNGGGMQRKNRHPNEDLEDDDNRLGVDLNRNFGYEWGYDNTGSSPDPTSQTYRGESPFSEPETQAVREFVNDHNFTISIFFHSYGDLVLYPVGYTYLQPDDLSLFSAMSKSMAVDSRYQTGTGWEIIYPTNGDSDDWLYLTDEHDPIMAVTLEVGDRDDHFWPPRNRLPALVEENIETCLIAAEYCDLPERFLSPPTPSDVNARTNPRGRITIDWEWCDDEVNPSESYTIRAGIPGEPIFDDAPEDQQLWILENFERSSDDHHSGSHSYRLLVVEDMATMTLAEEIVAPDTLWAWVNYNMRARYEHGVALEVSHDGHDWEPLPGFDSEDIVKNQINLGPALMGESDGWIRTEWYFGDYAGEMVRLRFRYWRLNISSYSEFAYIDDIGPLPVWEDSEILADDVENLAWIDWEHDLEDELYYQVQAVDAEGDLSFWSKPATVEVGPDVFDMRIPLGWSIISMPLIPIEPDLRDIFASIIDKNLLDLVKNDAGQFFIPRHNYNGIGDWNPLRGYQTRLFRTGDLSILGYFLDEDTPIPLPEGWSIFAYLPEQNAPVEHALSSIGENVVVVKNAQGLFWLPRWRYNNLPDLERGIGYHLNLMEADTLIYSINQDELDFSSRGGSYELDGFDPPSPDNHSLLFCFEDVLAAGTVSLLDGNGSLCGRIRYDAGQSMIGVAAWGESGDDGEGYRSGESFRAFWRAEGSETDIRLDLDLIEGDPVYERNGISVLSARLDRSTLPVEHGIISAFPNPFNSTCALKFSLLVPSLVELTVYDAFGRLVEEVGSGSYPVGFHSASWNASDKPSGLYLARLEVHSNSGITRSQTKLLLVR